MTFAELPEWAKAQARDWMRGQLGDLAWWDATTIQLDERIEQSGQEFDADGRPR